MKKIIFTTACAAMMTLSASSVFAADGQVNFKGEIIDSACVVVNDMDSPLEVTLGKVAKSSFTGVDSIAAKSKFTLALTDCPANLNNISVKFDGIAVGSDNSQLELTNAGTDGVAKGVAVKLYDEDNKEISLREASKDYAIVEGANNLDFYAAYIANGTVEAGTADATTTFSLTYN